MANPQKVGESTRLMSTPDVSLFPRDIFFIILCYLEPWDIIRCRRVSRPWLNAFSNSQNLSPILKRNFPFAREVRELRENHSAISGTPETATNYNEEEDRWRAAFDRVAARYYHLDHGKPRTIQKYAIWKSDPKDSYEKWCPVQPWECHGSHRRGGVIDFLFEPSPFWTYDDGLLVYASDQERCILILDLETNRSFRVPFKADGRVIRRLRLQQRVLAIEWAEPDAFHWLNGHDILHRHFASLFDVNPSADAAAQEDWEITFRNELKIMFLGYPLSDRDRFFSSHTGTHYAIYAWQPIRSLNTADGDAPIESLFVWDISQPSSYRPSEYPSGTNYEDEDGPKIIARFGFRDLEFYSVRQRGVPSMIRLEIDSEAGTLDITDNTRIGTRGVLDHYLWPPSLQSPEELTPIVYITSIPFIGHGPCWRRKTGTRYPPYRGNTSLQTEPFTAEGSSWYAGLSEAADEKAQVYHSLYFYSERSQWDSMRMLLNVRTPRSQATIEYSTVSEIGFKGRISGDERFVIGQNAENEVVVFRFDK